MSKKEPHRSQTKLNQVTQAAKTQVGGQYPVTGAQFGIQFEQTRTIFDPTVVKAYGELVPDAPERILKQFEENGAAARESQKALDDRQHLAITKQASDNSRRDWMAFALLTIMMILSGVFAYLQQPWLATGALVGLAGYVAIGYFKWRK